MIHSRGGAEARRFEPILARHFTVFDSEARLSDEDLSYRYRGVNSLRVSASPREALSSFDGAYRIAAIAEAPAQVAPTDPCAGAEGGS